MLRSTAVLAAAIALAVPGVADAKHRHRAHHKRGHAVQTWTVPNQTWTGPALEPLLGPAIQPH